jgi:hypothetical protein
MHPALRSEVTGEDIKGGEELQGVVGALGVEPGEPGQEAEVELGEIVEEQLLMKIEELLLDRTVKALAVRVHLGGAREGMPVLDALVGKGLVEVQGKLFAVI